MRAGNVETTKVKDDEWNKSWEMTKLTLFFLIDNPKFH